MTDSSRRGRDGSSVPERRPPERRTPVLGDDLPQILEVFGAAPLVREPQAQDQDQEEAQTRMNTGSTRDARFLSEDPRDWDPLASVEEDEEDESEAGSLGPAGAPGRSPGNGAGNTPPVTAQAATSDVASDAALDALGDLVRQGDERMGRIELGLQSLAHHSEFIPPKLRGLSKKVDEIAIAVGDVRVRSLLIEVVGLGDLVDGALRALPDSDGGAIGGARRFFRALAARIDQVLESHDAHAIPIDGGFDPTVHNAVDVLDVDDPALEGQIVELVRPGFRTEHSVLRYAEVAVGRYRESEEAPDRDAQPAEDAATRLGVRLSSMTGVDHQPAASKDGQGPRRKTLPGASETSKDKH